MPCAGRCVLGFSGIVVRQFFRSSFPEILADRVRIARRKPFFEAFREAGVIFVHVPRTGGTSISRALYPLWINHFTMREHLRTLPADLLTLPRFAVVRNPWDRVVSSWSFARAGAGADGAVVVNDTFRLPLHHLETFEGFVHNWLCDQPMHQLDSIFRTQSEFLTDSHGKIAVDHVGRLEDIGTTEEWLADILGKPIKFPRLNASSHEAYQQYYTPALREKVARVYASDIENFGYEF
jgi:chondroitin 4-sulfotransferase 11